MWGRKIHEQRSPVRELSAITSEGHSRVGALCLSGGTVKGRVTLEVTMGGKGMYEKEQHVQSGKTQRASG